MRESAVGLAELALLETYHMSGLLSEDVVAKIGHINGKLSDEQRWEVREFIDRVLKYGKATLTSPRTLISPEQQITVVYDGIWYFTLEPTIDGVAHEPMEVDELVILNRVASFVARKTEAQAELTDSQSTMRAMFDLIYSGSPTQTMVGEMIHPPSLST